MDKAPQVRLHSTAHYLLEGLNEIGVEYLFCNLGTDHAPFTIPGELADAVRHCLAEVRRGRSAVLHACVTSF